MKLLRWIAFLPVGALLIALAQLAVAFVAERAPFWTAAPVILFFGAIIAMAAIVPCQIAPDPKIGATILLTLFVFLELVALASFLPKAPVFPAVARLYADVVLVIGGFIGGSIRPEAGVE